MDYSGSRGWLREKKREKGDEGLCGRGNIWRELCAEAVGARMGGGAGCERSPIKKGREILRRKQEKWLRIAGVDNKGASLKKLT